MPPIRQEDLIDSEGSAGSDDGAQDKDSDFNAGQASESNSDDDFDLDQEKEEPGPSAKKARTVSDAA
jgi:hypothetical protein